MQKFITTLIAVGLLSLPLQAQVTIPHQFAAGEKALAAEVNANFQALAEALNQALERIDALEQENRSMAEALQSIAQSNVMAMDDFVEVMQDGGTTLRFSGVNLQLVNGSGTTDGEVNGLGNLIVGYNEDRDEMLSPVCSREALGNQAACESAGGVWTVSHKSGSHNIVGGRGNSYSGFGGLVVGRDNVISGEEASVSGGYNNSAQEASSSVSGGTGNSASGHYSSVSGGWSNSASGRSASISGGHDNTALGYQSSILGGQSQTIWTDNQTIPVID